MNIPKQYYASTGFGYEVDQLWKEVFPRHNKGIWSKDINIPYHDSLLLSPAFDFPVCCSFIVMVSLAFLVIAFIISSIYASPLNIRHSSSISPMPVDQEASYTPAAMFASAAYCAASKTIAWACGGKRQGAFRVSSALLGQDSNFWFLSSSQLPSLTQLPTLRERRGW
jgi:hypothetical protein